MRRAETNTGSGQGKERDCEKLVERAGKMPFYLMKVSIFTTCCFPPCGGKRG